MRRHRSGHFVFASDDGARTDPYDALLTRPICADLRRLLHLARLPVISTLAAGVQRGDDDGRHAGVIPLAAGEPPVNANMRSRTVVARPDESE